MNIEALELPKNESLSPEALDLLDENKYASSQKVTKRILMVFFVVFLGYSYSLVAKKLSTHPKVVSKWHKRYNAGLSFEDKQRTGRPRKFDKIIPELGKSIEQIVIETAITPPTKLTDHLTNWSTITLLRFLKKRHGIEISRSSLYRILVNQGLRKKKITEALISFDPEWEAKVAQINATIDEANNNDDVCLIYADEKGPMHALFHNDYHWCDKDLTLVFAKNKNGSNGKTILTAGWAPIENKWWWCFSESRNGAAYVKWLENLLECEYLAEKTTVYIIVDNLNTHFVKEVKEFFAENLKFKQLRLPTYSPQFNPIERMFGSMSSQAISNHWFEDVEELEKRVSCWIENQMQYKGRELRPIPMTSKVKTLSTLKEPQDSIEQPTAKIIIVPENIVYEDHEPKPLMKTSGELASVIAGTFEGWFTINAVLGKNTGITSKYIHVALYQLVEHGCLLERHSENQLEYLATSELFKKFEHVKADSFDKQANEPILSRPSYLPTLTKTSAIILTIRSFIECNELFKESFVVQACRELISTTIKESDIRSVVEYLEQKNYLQRQYTTYGSYYLQLPKFIRGYPEIESWELAKFVFKEFQ